MAAQQVKLDVGGVAYTTTRSTLLKYPQSKLGKLDFENGHVFFFDRDGWIFRFILNFLRIGLLLLPDGFKEIALLTAEAEFYSLAEMINAIEDWKSRKTLTVEERVFQQSGKKHPGTYIDWTIKGDRGAILWLTEIALFGDENESVTISDDGRKLHRSWYNDVRIGVTDDGYQYGFCNPEDPVLKECIFKELTSLGYRLRRRVECVDAPDVNALVRAFVHFNGEKSYKYTFEMFK